jgi:PAS domain S-box-containing protein
MKDQPPLQVSGKLQDLQDLQERLEASERRARALQSSLEATWNMIDSISEAVYMQDSKGQFLYVNEGAARMYGHSRGFFLGKTPEALSAPGRNDAGAVAKAFGQTLAGEPRQFEFWGLRADGTIFPMEVRLYPGAFQGQQVVLAIAQDVSGRKRAEQIRDATYRISEVALKARDLPTLYRSVHDILRTLLPAENCYVALHDPKTNLISFPYWVDQVDEAPQPRPFGRGLTEYVLRTGQPHLIDGATWATLFGTGEAQPIGTEGLAWLGVPLRSDRGIFGALVVQSYEGGHHYGPEDLEILSFVSAQIAMVIETKGAESALRYSEDKFSRAFQLSPDAINITRLEDGMYLEINEGFEKMIGWTREELIGHRAIDLDIWVDLQDRRHIIDLIRTQGECSSLEIPFRRKDGRHIIGLMSGKSMEVGGVPCVLSIIRDISDRKASESALRVAEQRLRTVMANSQAVIYQLDPNGQFLLSEGLGLASLGLNPGQVVGRSALELYAGDPDIVDQIHQALKGEASRRISRVGDRVFDNTLTPVLDTQGQVESVIGIATDVTERQETEEALRAERGLFVGGPVMVIRWQSAPPWPVDYISPNVQALLGYAPEDLTTGRISFETLIHPEDRLRVHQEADMQRCKGLTHYEQQYRLRNATGAYRWFHDFTTLAGQGSQAPYYLGYMLDTTDRRQAEDALRQSQKLESLGILAGGIAHDFNNLLAVVLGNLNIAQMHLPEGAQARPYLAKMEATVLRATELTKQMLAYSGRGHFVVKPYDLNEVVREVTHLLEVSISKKIRLRFDLEPDLPAIQADAGQIQQVVMNLVTNASDAIGDRDGGIHLSTSVATFDERELRSIYHAESLKAGRYVLLEVTDTGSGMTSEVMARIFDPFFTTKATGRGLGLSAMLGILKGHGAGLHITSEEGRGSSFRLCFPASEEPTALSPPATEANSSRRLQGRILLVDDEDRVLETIGSALSVLGLEVLFARDGLEALERFREDRPDLVLMDLTMPRMDGREAFRAMHDLDPSIPVVLSSGYAAGDTIGTHAGEGPAGFLQKPYQIRELRLLLEQVLRS